MPQMFIQIIGFATNCLILRGDGDFLLDNRIPPNDGITTSSICHWLGCWLAQFHADYIITSHSLLSYQLAQFSKLIAGLQSSQKGITTISLAASTLRLYWSFSIKFLIWKSIKWLKIGFDIFTGNWHRLLCELPAFWCYRNDFFPTEYPID